jgi:hypothetical protein
MESYYEDDSPLAALLEGRSRRRAFLANRTSTLTCCCRPWHRRRLVQLPQPGALAYSSLHPDCRAAEALAQALYPAPKPPLPCSGHCLQASPSLVGMSSSRPPARNNLLTYHSVPSTLVLAELRTTASSNTSATSSSPRSFSTNTPILAHYTRHRSTVLLSPTQTCPQTPCRTSLASLLQPVLPLFSSSYSTGFVVLD